MKGLPEGYGQCSGERMNKACAPYDVNATKGNATMANATSAEDEKDE